MFSLISANTRGETVSEFTTQPNQPVGLYVDVPADAAYSTYGISLLIPRENDSLRSLSYAEAQNACGHQSGCGGELCCSGIGPG